jgi:hypothetical protein
MEVSTCRSLDSLPVELIQEILLHLSIADLSRVCQVCSNLSTFGRDWNFWAEKAWREYQFPHDLFKSTPLTYPRNRYVQVRYYCQNEHDALYQLIGRNWDPSAYPDRPTDPYPDPRFKSQLTDPEDQLYQERLFRYLVGRGAHSYNYGPITWAAIRGDAQLVDQLLNNWTPNLDNVLHLNEALEGAAEGGHLDLVKDLIRRGAYSLRSALDDAIRSNHLHVVEYLISQGSNDVKNYIPHERSDSHREVLLKVGKRKRRVSLSRALGLAASKGHLEIVKCLFEHRDCSTDLDEGAVAAADRGHLEIVKWLFDHGADDYERSLQAAARNGHLDVVKYLIERGAQEFDWSLPGGSEYRRFSTKLDWPIREAQEHKQDHILAYLLSIQ